MCGENSGQLAIIKGRDEDADVFEPGLCRRCAAWAVARQKCSLINIPYQIRKERDDDV
jgi:hypothetical protein